MFDTLRRPHRGRVRAIRCCIAATATIVCALAGAPPRSEADPTPTGLETAWRRAMAAEAQMIAPTEALNLTTKSTPPGRWNLGGPAAVLAPRDLAPVTVGGITWLAPSQCVPTGLRKVLADVVAHFGPIVVTSTCRPAPLNRAVGGADHSYHLTGEAIDFRVPLPGIADAVQAHLLQSPGVGGLKHYGDGLFHIDNGPRRTW